VIWPAIHCCDVDPDEVWARQPDDDEGIEQVEANVRYVLRPIEATLVPRDLLEKVASIFLLLTFFGE
jgi:hypothetical protein